MSSSSRRTSIAASDKGTRCGSPFLLRSAGIVHQRASSSDVFPTHRDDFATALGGEESQLQYRGDDETFVRQRIPEPADVIFAQHVVAVADLGRPRQGLSSTRSREIAQL